MRQKAKRCYWESENRHAQVKTLQQMDFEKINMEPGQSQSNAIMDVYLRD